ncbi:phosphatidylinositol/phosphatidylcholine transfer protein SFH9-like isoform X1 [Zingiber officinale]|uniref:phosphatidylinositol/phosphatidylcholine transfer protein SFH9-like isoform X1 n=2 Tax=Zingiber officinale TaxID=94328 RepID=UPI001C4B6205|nr:phosphatidylinositol/phosphatidylcholine transfer protein SFH9-like isoform X1 [Zingiber officinale]XP_042458857.1 phosphatidylinositol/phosphatidylcholine transfer protein SFH9-like isoform X1 [Zingiber officinale]
MGIASQDASEQLSALIDQLDAKLKHTFQNMHQGNPKHTLARFLKAREWNALKANKMLVDCLNWRMQNQIDDILCKPITPANLYRGIRDSQLMGLSGYTKQGVPVFAIGAGLTTFDKASVNYYIQSHIQMNEYRDRVVLPAASRKHGRYIGTCFKVLDMTGLKFSSLSNLKLVSLMATIDDLNYPEKTETYYIVNAPYIFSACWKVVKPLLQERTRRKVQVLDGCGKDELLKIMDYASLPHFCKRNGSRSSRYSSLDSDDCYSFDHPFHQEFYNYIVQQAKSKNNESLIKHGSLHVDVPEPDPEGIEIINTIESELHKIGNQNGVTRSLSGLKIV